VADDMAVSPDGRELYFLGIHRAGVGSADIWRSRRIDRRWSTAEVLPPPVNTPGSEVYPVIVADGSLYFTSTRPGGLGRSSLYRAQRLADGGFAAPVLVPPPINSEFGVGDTYVSPDERYMVMSSSRPPSPGGGDLFVSSRRPGGEWSEPAHLGPGINTDQVDFCPMITPDGRFLFFSRRQGASWPAATAGDVYWVDAKILEQFRR
jgi:Tol biopolymer transport system component